MTNGGAETGVRLLKGQLKVLRSDLESRLGKKVPTTHPIMAWVVMHCADVRTLRVRGTDGRTAFQTIRGERFSTWTHAFGESCLFKLRAHERVHGQIGRLGKGCFV